MTSLARHRDLIRNRSKERRPDKVTLQMPIEEVEEVEEKPKEKTVKKKKKATKSKKK